MAFEAAGKRVLITGASSGIGAAPARRLAGDYILCWSFCGGDINPGSIPASLPM
jgi:hypothetical protein